MLIIQLLAFAAAAVWGFRYYYRSTAEAPQSPPEELPEEMPERVLEPPQMDRRQLEKIASNCLWGMMTETERQEASIYMKCRSLSDSELTEIIERYKTEY